MRDFVEQALLGLTFITQNISELIKGFSGIHLRLVHTVTGKAIHLEAVRTGLVVLQVFLDQIPLTGTRGRAHVVLVALVHDVLFPFAIANGTQQLTRKTAGEKALAAKLQLSVVIKALAVGTKHRVITHSRQAGSPHAVAEVHGRARTGFHHAASPTGKLLAHTVLTHAHKRRGVGGVDAGNFSELTNLVLEREYHFAIGRKVAACQKRRRGVHLHVAVGTFAHSARHVAAFVLKKHGSAGLPQPLGAMLFGGVDIGLHDNFPSGLVLAIAELVVEVTVRNGAREARVAAVVYDSLVATIGETVVHAVFVKIFLGDNTAHIVGSFAGASREHFGVVRHGAHERTNLPLIEHGHLVDGFGARIEVRL